MCIGELEATLQDYVYVRRAQTQAPLLGRIDRLWSDEYHQQWATVTVFMLPTETRHPPTQVFYPREVVRTRSMETVSAHDILGLCSVLDAQV